MNADDQKADVIRIVRGQGELAALESALATLEASDAFKAAKAELEPLIAECAKLDEQEAAARADRAAKEAALRDAVAAAEAKAREAVLTDPSVVAAKLALK